jgi:predicted MPP superfamily phosphohydrolase
MPDALIDRISSVEYDICVLTGDFRAKTTGSYDATLAGMERVCAHISKPMYGILGNHDTICMVPGLEAMGIRMLLNESVAVERSGSKIYLAGVDDPHYYLADNMEKAINDIPLDAVTILLSHSPELYQHAAHAGFDLMLCGHTHGGQICLPGGVPLFTNVRCPRQYSRKSWRYHNLTGYTSFGSGVSIVDVRLNCPPEITIHHLHRKEN